MIRYDGLQRGNLFIISILEKISKGRILAPTNHSQDVLVGVLVLKKKKSRVMTISHHRSQHHFISSLIYTSLICGIWDLASEEEGNIQKKLLQGQIQARTSGLKQHFVQFNIKFTSLSLKSSSTEPLKLIFFCSLIIHISDLLFHLIFKYWSYCSHSCSITKTQPYTVISMYGYTSTILIPLPINDLDRRVMIMGC